MVPLGTHPAGQAGIVGTGLIHFGVCVWVGGVSAPQSQLSESAERGAKDAGLGGGTEGHLLPTPSAWAGLTALHTNHSAQRSPEAPHPTLGRPRGTHRLGVHEKRGALGAGGEHLGRADKLGADAPEVISQVTGRITR